MLEEKDLVEEVSLADEVVKLQQEKAQMEEKLREQEKKRKEAEIALVNLRPSTKKEEELLQPKEYVKKLTEPQTNRAYWENVIKYRQSMLNKTGKDIFSDDGNILPQTQQVFDTIKTLLEETQGNDRDFNYKLQNILRDDPSIKKFKK